MDLRNRWYTWARVGSAWMILFSATAQPICAESKAKTTRVVPADEPLLLDLALGEKGELKGTVVDSRGLPQAGCKVGLQVTSGEMLATHCDREGQFSFAALSGGNYILVAGDDSCVVRAWTTSAAPPHASEQVKLTTNELIVRGQSCGCGDSVGCADCVGTGGHRKAGAIYGNRPIVTWMRRHPGLTVAGVATAIAVPVAIAADDDSGS